MGKRDEKPQAVALVKSAAMGGIAATILALLLAAILAALILAGLLPESGLRTAAMAAIVLAAFAGGLLAANAAGHKRLPVAIGAMAIFALLALLGKTAFHTQGGADSLPILLAIFGGGILAGLLSSRKKKRRR